MLYSIIEHQEQVGDDEQPHQGQQHEDDEVYRRRRRHHHHHHRSSNRRCSLGDTMRSIYVYYYTLVGIVSMLPWIITFCVFEYFDEFYSENSSIVMLIVQFPNVAVSVWCACITVKESPIQTLRRRMYIGLLSQMITICCIIVLLLLTSHDPCTIYYICIIFSFLLNFSCAAFSNSSHGLAMVADKPILIIYKIGQAIGGLLIAIIFTTPRDDRLSYIICFLTMSVSLTLLCIIMTGHITDLFDNFTPDDVDIVMFHHFRRGGITPETMSDAIQQAQDRRSLSNATRTLHYANLFALSFTTMNVYPSIFQYIDPVLQDGGFIAKFSPTLMTFIVFNVCVLIGSLMVCVIPSPNDYMLTGMVMMKVLLVPIFYIGNFIPPVNAHQHQQHQRRLRHHAFLLQSNDIYIATLLVFGLMTGYLCTACTIKIRENELGIARLARAGRVSAAIIAIGSIVGLVLSHYSIKVV